MMEEYQERKGTAYHEAGHAVIGLHFDIASRRVTIKPDGDTQGRCSPCLYDFPNKRAQNMFIRREIIMLYAGGEAEKRVNPFFDPESSTGNDEAAAFNALKQYPVRGCSYVGDAFYRAYLERLRGEASQLVGHLWPTIILVAEKLLEQEELSGQEVIDLFTLHSL